MRFTTADAALQMRVELDIVSVLTGQKNNRSYSYESYIDQMTL